jgi:hypothetical protein
VLLVSHFAGWRTGRNGCRGLAGRRIEQVKAEELGTFTKQLEFTSAVELMILKRAGVVVDEAA